jgi:hypothetical protein
MLAAFRQDLKRIEFRWGSAASTLESRGHHNKISKLRVSTQSPQRTFSQDGIVGRRR